MAWRLPIVPGFVAALAGRSRYIITGPTNTTGLLVLGALVPFLGVNGLLEPTVSADSPRSRCCAACCGFSSRSVGGAVIFRFIPESVLAGFTIGAGILIGVMQLDEALGLPAVNGAGLSEEYFGLMALLDGGRAPVADGRGCVTVLSVAAVALGQRIWRRVPTALVVVAGAAFVAWAFGLDAHTGLPLVGDRAGMPHGWPPGALPDLRPGVIAEPAGAIGGDRACSARSSCSSACVPTSRDRTCRARSWPRASPTSPAHSPRRSRPRPA